MTAILDRNPAEVMAALQAATSNLSPEERVRVTEGVARSMREATRAQRWATPGALAVKLDPTVVQTPAMDKLDELLLGVDRALKGEADGIRRGGAFLPPQEGKSTRISQHGLAWLLSRHPQLRIGIVSYEQTIALRSGRAVRDLIDTHGSAPDRDLSHDLLGIAVDPDERAESRWKLKGHRGGVVSVGIGGALTGRPLDVLVVDDPIKDARAADSLLIRQRAWDWYSSTARTRLAPGGIVLVVQTRWHEDDLSGRLIEQDRARPAERRLWTWVNIPAQGIGPLKPGDTRLPDSLGRPAGEYMLSARGRSLADWEETRDEVAGRDWSAMYQQNPTPAEGTVFQWAWINRYRRSVPGGPDGGDPATQLPAAAKRAVAVDTSAGGTDEAGLVAGFRGTDGVVYVTHDRSAPMTSAQWARAAWLLCVDTDADTLVWEKNLAGPTMRTELVRAWRLLQRQARVLRRRIGDDLVADDDALDAAARQLADADAGGSADDELVADTRTQLQELAADRLRRILTAPDSGYAQLHGVQATSGKRTRATPIAAQYETGRQRHVGFLPELEQQMTTWQEGQDSPDRMDAVVWLGHYLGAAPHRTRARTPTATTIPRGPQVRGR